MMLRLADAVACHELEMRTKIFQCRGATAEEKSLIAAIREWVLSTHASYYVHNCQKNTNTHSKVKAILHSTNISSLPDEAYGRKHEEGAVREGSKLQHTIIVAGEHFSEVPCGLLIHDDIELFMLAGSPDAIVVDLSDFGSFLGWSEAKTKPSLQVRALR